MKKITIYANYGILNHEKETLYSIQPDPDAIISEQRTYVYPPDLKIYVNNCEVEMVESPDGEVWSLRDVLGTDSSDHACILIPHGPGNYHKYMLTEVVA